MAAVAASFTEQVKMAAPDVPRDDSTKGGVETCSKWLRKTKLCTYYLQGTCNLGAKCNFAHSKDEVQVAPNLLKTQLCPDFEKGMCNKLDCSFAHGAEELRISPSFKKKMCKWFGKGKCRNGDDCGFAHGISEMREPEPAPLEPAMNMAGLAPPPGLSLPVPEKEHAKVSLMLESNLLDKKCEAPLQEQVQTLNAKIGELQGSMEGMMLRAQVAQMKQVVEQLSAQCSYLASAVAASEETTPTPVATTSLKTKLNSNALSFVPCQWNVDATPFVPADVGGQQSSGSSTYSEYDEPAPATSSSSAVDVDAIDKDEGYESCIESGDESTSVGTDVDVASSD